MCEQNGKRWVQKHGKEVNCKQQCVNTAVQTLDILTEYAKSYLTTLHLIDGHFRQSQCWGVLKVKLMGEL